jgi:hypothetical protein
MANRKYLRIIIAGVIVILFAFITIRIVYKARARQIYNEICIASEQYQAGGANFFL